VHVITDDAQRITSVQTVVDESAVPAESSMT
jgi:hypothetical protein